MVTKKSNPYNEISVRELQLYTENDRAIYDRKLNPILRNLSKKQEKGIYDKEKAQKLYLNAVNDGAKKYTQEFGTKGSKIFSTSDKKEVAKRLEEENRDELKYYR